MSVPDQIDAKAGLIADELLAKLRAGTIRAINIAVIREVTAGRPWLEDMVLRLVVEKTAEAQS
jgi:hypothetical protein